eukprot:g77534.t1
MGLDIMRHVQTQMYLTITTATCDQVTAKISKFLKNTANLAKNLSKFLAMSVVWQKDDSEDSVDRQGQEEGFQVSYGFGLANVFDFSSNFICLQVTVAVKRLWLRDHVFRCSSSFV